MLIDGLAFGALHAGSCWKGSISNIAALVHHPFARETGLDPGVAAARACRRPNATALALRAGGVIATSAHTALALAADYGGIARGGCSWPSPNIFARLSLACGPRSRADRRSVTAVPCLLTVATVTPRKGHDVLVAALARLADLPWTSGMVGSLSRAPDNRSLALRAQIARSGVADRITLAGEVSADALERFYTEADVFVLPSRYEGYGMAFAEALASRLTYRRLPQRARWPTTNCRATRRRSWLPRGRSPTLWRDALRGVLITHAGVAGAHGGGRLDRRTITAPMARDTAAHVVAAL